MLLNSGVNNRQWKRFFIPAAIVSVTIGLSLFSLEALAGETIKTGAEKFLLGMKPLGQVIGALSWVGGAAFAIGAIFKFKQHKDNPTQIPIGTPIALLFVGAALLFLPTILNVAGYSFFEQLQSAGPTGNIPGLATGT